MATRKTTRKTTRKAPEAQVELIRDYELVLIISPESEDEALEASINKVSQYISDKGGTIDEVQRWGKKKLAYPIGHFLEGNYVLARFKLKPASTRELETNLKISEEILRHLLIRIE